MKKMIALALALGVLVTNVQAAQPTAQPTRFQRFKHGAHDLWSRGKNWTKDKAQRGWGHVRRNKGRYATAAALMALIGSLIAAERSAYANSHRSSAALSKDEGLRGYFRRGAAKALRGRKAGGFLGKRYGYAAGTFQDKLAQKAEEAVAELVLGADRAAEEEARRQSIRDERAAARRVPAMLDTAGLVGSDLDSDSDSSDSE